MAKWKSIELGDRFWSKVHKTQTCWNWQASFASNGYGHYYFDGRLWASHRLSFFALKGPLGKFQVCHQCDNPVCVNPDHLFLGTQKDNIHDMMRKGRHIARPKVAYCKRGHSALLYRRVSAAGSSWCVACNRLKIGKPFMSPMRRVVSVEYVNRGTIGSRQTCLLECGHVKIRYNYPHAAWTSTRCVECITSL